MKMFPILYSFRRCPYAMRARMAICQANIRCELREVILKDKPESMLSLSNKGTVPVIVTPENTIIDQSLDVMSWALEKSDPDAWLEAHNLAEQSLVEVNDNDFKYYLDRYKYHTGYPEYSQEHYRDKASNHLNRLEQLLSDNEGIALTSKRLAFADIAIFPFVRQFANVDFTWFQSSPYDLIKRWYATIEKGDLFQRCMNKYIQWSPDDSPIYFP